MLFGQSFCESPMTSQVDGAAVTAAAATSLLPAAAKKVIPDNYFQIGRKMRIKAWGRISTVVTTPGTARFDVRLGSNVVFDSQAIALATADAYTTVPWFLYVDMTCRAIGATTAANFFVGGYWLAPNVAGVVATPPKTAGVALLPWNAAPAVGAGFDSTVTNIVDLFFTQTVATGSCTCHQFELELPN
jgi:hypothetical protein